MLNKLIKNKITWWIIYFLISAITFFPIAFVYKDTYIDLLSIFAISIAFVSVLIITKVIILKGSFSKIIYTLIFYLPLLLFVCIGLVMFSFKVAGIHEFNFFSINFFDFWKDTTHGANDFFLERTLLVLWVWIFVISIIVGFGIYVFILFNAYLFVKSLFTKQRPEYLKYLKVASLLLMEIVIITGLALITFIVIFYKYITFLLPATLYPLWIYIDKIINKYTKENKFTLVNKNN